MKIFWPASFVKFPWHCWTEFSQSWKDLRKKLWSHENLPSLTDLSGPNIGFHSNSRDWLFGMFMISKIDPFWEDVSTVFSFFIKNSRNAIPKYKHIIAPHESSTCIEYINLYQNCTDSVALIWSNVMLNIRNKVDKDLSELNKLTVWWYIISASEFMEWYVALLIKYSRYFCCSSKINLMKGKLFFGQFPK